MTQLPRQNRRRVEALSPRELRELQLELRIRRLERWVEFLTGRAGDLIGSETTGGVYGQAHRAPSEDR